MSSSPFTILLVEDDPLDVAPLRQALAPPGPDDPGAPPRLLTAATLDEAAAAIGGGGVDVVLLDLALGGARALEALAALRDRAPDAPIVALVPPDEEGAGLAALDAGALDYLVKGRLDPDTLRRSLRHVTERHRLRRALDEASLTDPLTGLYNRRGFVAHAERAVHLAQRKRRGLLVAYADIDGLAQINDTFGRADGDRALVAAARILRSCVRVSDIVARIGGDELVAMLIEAPPAAIETVSMRFQARIDAYNATRDHAWGLTLTVGFAATDGAPAPTLDELLAEAEQALAARSGEGRARVLP
jgi:diguanylate cyclase (GGDEF)-like protein